MDIGLHMTQGDTLPLWVDYLTDSANVPVSIQGQTLTLSLRRYGYAETPTILNASVTNLDTGAAGTIGKFSYAWVAGQTAVPGIYLVEIKATSGSGVQRHPSGTFLIQIRPAVAT